MFFSVSNVETRPGWNYRKLMKNCSQPDPKGVEKKKDRLLLNFSYTYKQSKLAHAHVIK